MLINTSQTHHNYVTKIPGDLVLRKIKFRETNYLEVKEILNAIKPNKATRYDTISPRVVRASRESIAEPLSKLINTVWKYLQAGTRRKYKHTTKKIQS